MSEIFGVCLSVVLLVFSIFALTTSNPAIWLEYSLQLGRELVQGWAWGLPTIVATVAGLYVYVAGAQRVPGEHGLIKRQHQLAYLAEFLVACVFAAIPFALIYSVAQRDALAQWFFIAPMSVALLVLGSNLGSYGVVSPQEILNVLREMELLVARRLDAIGRSPMSARPIWAFFANVATGTLLTMLPFWALADEPPWGLKPLSVAVVLVLFLALVGVVGQINYDSAIDRWSRLASYVPGALILVSMVLVSLSLYQSGDVALGTSIVVAMAFCMISIFGPLGGIIPAASAWTLRSVAARYAAWWLEIAQARRKQRVHDLTRQIRAARPSRLRRFRQRAFRSR